LNENSKPIGVIGAGSFGTAIANILAEKSEVLMYVRNPDRIEATNEKRYNSGQQIHSNIKAILSEEELASRCQLIFPMVPSNNFRKMIKSFAPYLRPDHILIHGTKGVDVVLTGEERLSTLNGLGRSKIRTMSEVIQEETSVVRIGCLAGPNLSAEMAQKQPAGALVASPFKEVTLKGNAALNIARFKVFESTDLLGAEFAGILKNIFAIAAGILSGLGYGNNARSLLITKGLHEMLHLGNDLGGATKAFLGIAGIGDLIATCSSELSRNNIVGRRIATGDKIDDILADMDEVAEGIRSVLIFNAYCKATGITAPITQMLYKVIFQGKDPLTGVQILMDYNYNNDVSFLD